MSTSMTPLTGTSKATTVTPFRSILSATKLCTGAAPGIRRRLPPKGEAGRGLGQRSDVSEARDAIRNTQQAHSEPSGSRKSGSGRMQVCAAKSREEEHLWEGRGVCVCARAHVQAWVSRQDGSALWAPWPPRSMQGLSAAIRPQP